MGYHKFSKATDEAISEALKADYQGPEGAKLREIDRENGMKDKGKTWKSMRKGESREIIAADGTRIVLTRKK